MSLAEIHNKSLFLNQIKKNPNKLCAGFIRYDSNNASLFRLHKSSGINTSGINSAA